jgi:tetratricopeptide (TPR) repeat protein
VAAKTHDMIYKPPIKLSADIERHAELLGESVQLVERQSDIIRHLVERELHREVKRRKAAQIRMMTLMTEPSDTDYNRQAADLAWKISGDLDHLRRCRESDPRLNDYFREWQRFKDDVGPNRAVSRVITFLASIHETQDLTKIARETIREWIKASSDGAERSAAFVFRAMARYLFGDFEEAITAAKEALAYAEAHHLPTVSAKGNVAYFLAEHYFHKEHRLDKTQRTAIRKELAALSRFLKSTGRTETALLDNLGWVIIATGRTPHQIRLGLGLCHRALESVMRSDPLYPSRKAYSQLHEERAFQRLLDWG